MIGYGNLYNIINMPLCLNHSPSVGATEGGLWPDVLAKDKKRSTVLNALTLMIGYENNRLLQSYMASTLIKA